MKINWYDNYRSDRKESLSDRDYLMHYFKKNYSKYLLELKDGQTILEIGSNDGSGYRGVSNILKGRYFTYTGIDLSKEDIAIARNENRNANFIYADAFSWLSTHKNEYDFIVMRAVLEHISKDKIVDLLQLIKESLKVDGIVIIDVPNMDWFLASHERYMDFTHQVGFTPDSLSQVMREVFGNVIIECCDIPRIFSKFNYIKNLLVKIGRGILGSIIRMCEPDINVKSVLSRDIMCVCKRENK